MEMNLKAIQASMQEHSTKPYKCPECGKLVVDAVMTIPVTGKRVKVERYGCQCYQKAELDKYLNESDYSHNADIYERSGIGKRFKQCTFESFRLFPDVKDSFDIVADYAECFETYKDKGAGLILKGKPGCGKTHLAAAVSQELIFRGYSVKFILTPVLLEEIRKSFNKKYGEVETDILKQLASVQLLVLDDLGAEKPTEWVIEQLFILINKRYEEMKPTIITTNCTGQELALRIGERTASRLVEVSKIVNIKAGDYRMKKAI